MGHMKKCSECHLEKDDVGKNGKCKLCNTIYMRTYREKNTDKIKKYQQEYDAQYYKENKDQILADKKEYYQENRDEILEDRKEYYEENKHEKSEYNKLYYQENRDDIIAQASAYYHNNKDKVRRYCNQYNKDRRKDDPIYAIRASVSSSINIYLKSKNSSKNGNSISMYLSYSIQELKNHLEIQFEPWMSWENYGRYDPETWDDNDPATWTWQLDHIIPHSTFHYTSMEDQAFRD